MKKSCTYCGRIHDRNYICPKKPVRKKHSTDQSKFRSSYAWTKKALTIKRRDGYLCQVCLRGLYEPRRRHESDNLEVHHIEKVVDCYDRRLEGDNLITLCGRHHEMADAGLIPASLLTEIAREQGRSGTDACGIPPGSAV